MQFRHLCPSLGLLHLVYASERIVVLVTCSGLSRRKSGDRNRDSRSTATVLFLQVAFKFGDAAKALEKSDDTTISSLLKALPFEMMCDIVNVTPALEVEACTDVLQQAMGHVSLVQTQACTSAFSQACMALQVRVSSSTHAPGLHRDLLNCMLRLLRLLSR